MGFFGRLLLSSAMITEWTPSTRGDRVAATLTFLSSFSLSGLVVRESVFFGDTSPSLPTGRLWLLVVGDVDV